LHSERKLIGDRIEYGVLVVTSSMVAFGKDLAKVEEH